MKQTLGQQKVGVRIEAGGASIVVPGWNGFKLGPGRCRVVLDGKTIALRLDRVSAKNGRTVLRWKSRAVSVMQELVPCSVRRDCKYGV